MPNINLLPWRETLKKERETRFGIITGAALAVTGLIVLAIHLYVAGLISYQQQRNQYLKNKIAEMDKKIEQIKDLAQKKERLIARMDVIQNLEASRPEIVHLFDELVKRVPDGVFFTEMRQEKDKLSLTGVAQSDARVSSLMKNIERSPWLAEPKIIEIVAQEIDSSGDKSIKHSVSTFVLEVKQISPENEDEEF